MAEHDRRLAVHHVHAAGSGKYQHAVIQHLHDRLTLLEQAAQAELLGNGAHRRLDHAQRMRMILFAGLSDVQHADQSAVGRKDGRGGTAPAFAAEPEMFGPDDLHRPPFGQTGPDAVGAARLLGIDAAHQRIRIIRAVRNAVGDIQGDAPRADQTQGADGFLHGREHLLQNVPCAVHELGVFRKNGLQFLSPHPGAFLDVRVHPCRQAALPGAKNHPADHAPVHLSPGQKNTLLLHYGLLALLGLQISVLIGHGVPSARFFRYVKYNDTDIIDMSIL